MVSSQSVTFVFLIAMSIVVIMSPAVAGEGFFWRRPNRYQQKSFQRPLTTHFRHRVGAQQGRSPNTLSSLAGSKDMHQQPLMAVSTSERDATYAAAPAYDSYGGSSYGGGGGGGSSGFSHSSGGNGINALSVLVAPLAALALLGAAAAVSTNPVLLSMVVLSSGRKRRDLISTDDDPELETKLQEIEVLEQYIAKVPDHEEQHEKLMATYLSCSGFTEERNGCIDRIVCEYSVQPSGMADLERDVISIVLYNILSNVYVSNDYKDRLRLAAQYGRNIGHCSTFVCDQLENQIV